MTISHVDVELKPDVSELFGSIIRVEEEISSTLIFSATLRRLLPRESFSAPSPLSFFYISPYQRYSYILLHLIPLKNKLYLFAEFSLCAGSKVNPLLKALFVAPCCFIRSAAYLANDSRVQNYLELQLAGGKPKYLNETFPSVILRRINAS
jgi:hypothetical protein